MKETVFSFVLVVILTFCVSAQTSGARKIADFEDYTCDDLITRLQDLEIELSNEPQSKGFIIVYEGKYYKNILPRFGESVSRTRTMQKRWRFFGYPSDKLLFISGGFRKKHAVEFWVVPNGANPPKPTPTLKKIKYRKGRPTDICEEFG